MTEYKKSTNRSVVFASTSVLVVALGVALCLLGKMFGGCREEWPFLGVVYGLTMMVESGYLRDILISAAICVLVCKVFSWGCSKKKVAVALGSVLLIWNVFMGAMCVWYNVEEENTITLDTGIGMPWKVDRAEEIAVLRSKSVWIGRGEHYYTYPEYTNMLLINEELQVEDAVREVVEKEHLRIGVVFSQWGSEELLPVLSYCFGTVIFAVYCVIVAVWIGAAVWGGMSLKGLGSKVLYGSCGVLMGMLLGAPALDYLGIVRWTLPVVFTTADLTALIPCGVLPLTVMYMTLTGE